MNDEQTITFNAMRIDEEYCREMFDRSGAIKQINVSIPSNMLMD